MARCKCKRGCTAQVITPGRKYAQGHFQRRASFARRAKMWGRKGAIKQWRTRRRHMLKVRKHQNVAHVRRTISESIKSKWKNRAWRKRLMATRYRTMYNNPEWFRNCIDKATRARNRKFQGSSWNAGLTKHNHPSLMVMSIRNKGRIPDYGRFRCWYSGSNGRIRMRSSYELAYAKWLDSQGLPWKYEPVFFHLRDGGSYTPDFFLPGKNLYVEVKGYFSKAQQKKFRAFKKEYPQVRVLLLEKETLRQLGVLPEKRVRNRAA